MNDRYEEAKQQLIAEHIRREGSKELSEAEKYVLWFIDQEKKLNQENMMGASSGSSPHKPHI